MDPPAVPMMASLAQLNSALSGRYEVERELGHGGMATVYLARDLRHGRPVALKVLRPELSAVIGAERFAQEIRMTANLQHPHILPLYDSGDVDGVVYYVMPYVEGESVRDRLQRETQFPIDEALRIITEVAGALDYAHRQGVVHRDIKPENILLHDGQAFVADFGIALAVSRSDAGTRLTETGMSLGTPSYMSPEQAMGQRDISPRADIYALGCVLYEMLTGEPPFAGASAQAVVAKILTDRTPSVRRQRERVPVHVDEAIQRALEKLPADRFGSAKQLADAINARDTPMPSSVVVSRPPRMRLLVALVVGVVVGAGTAAAIMAARAPRQATVWRGDLLGGPATAMAPRVSPDGQSVAFVGFNGGQTQVGLLRPASGDWTILTKDTTRGLVQTVAWAPDNSRIYYDRISGVPAGVYSISLFGGDEKLVLENASDPVPLPDGSIIVSRINARREYQAYRYWPESGRLDSLNARAEPSPLPYAFMRAFPDGTHLAYLGRPAKDTSAAWGIYVLDLSRGHDKLVYATRARSPIAIAPDGKHILTLRPSGDMYRIVALAIDGSSQQTLASLGSNTYDLDVARDGSLYFDQGGRDLEILSYRPGQGRPRLQVVDGISSSPILPTPDGRFLFAARTAGAMRVLAVRPGGQPTPFALTPDQNSFPFAMLGSDRVLLVLGDSAHLSIGIIQLSTGRVVGRLPQRTMPEAVAGSPDGKTVYSVSHGEVWSIGADGSGLRRVTTGDGVAVEPDGRHIIVDRATQDSVRLVRVWLADGREQPIRVNGGPFAGYLTPNAIGPGGRLAIVIAPPNSWFWPAAVLDPGTGAVQVNPLGTAYDMKPGWAPDGSVVAALQNLESHLWRMRPVTH